MDKTRFHRISRYFRQPPAIVFRALITPSQIRGWWSVRRAIVIPKTGGIWAATWGDNEDSPDYVSSATIKVFEPNRNLVLGDYQYISPDGGLPFEANFETTFEVRPKKEGTELTVTQTGFPVDPIADEYYAACETGWSQSLDALERFLDEHPDSVTGR
jgi:uncharacterized protein YndB with AHSA1/START domain